MIRKLFNILAVVALLGGLLSAGSAKAMPISGEQNEGGSTRPEDMLYKSTSVKPIDQPNPVEYLRMMEIQRLREAGKMAEAAALAKTGSDRVLVVLVEFGGTDTFTWKPGDTWDPLNKTDPNEVVYDANGYAVLGDCSNIITATTTFTYTGPMHNELPRPASTDNTVWSEDFSPDWFKSFMFENGLVISYTGSDDQAVKIDFTGKSVTDFYKDLSGGTYTVTGDVVGWVPVPHSEMWYGADACPGAISAGSSSVADGEAPGGGSPRTLVKDSLMALKAKVDAGQMPGFDWHDYDQNGDGFIDRLWIVHSGLGEEEGTQLDNVPYGEGAVWSHSSGGSVIQITDDIKAGPYIMMPENGGIGVFAHEYAHNLGADDLYAYGLGETSAGFWTTMADDWTGYPIGYQPPSMDPWHLDNWGWLNPMVVTDTSKVYEVTLGQTSHYPDAEGMYRGVRIELPDGQAPLAIPPWQGSHYFFSGKQDLANGTMTTADPISIPADATSASLSFDMVYDIEPEWDFLWVQASSDGGTTWDFLKNGNMTCTHDPDWIGGSYGIPDGTCGFTAWNADFPNPEQEVFDLSDYAGKNVSLRLWYMTDWGTTNNGAFIDNVLVEVNGAPVLSDNAETDSGKWVFQAPMLRSNGFKAFTQNYYVQWRNVGQNGGYDSSLGDPKFRYGPANTGLLMWYNNNYYSDNEIGNYLTDWPSFGPKGRMLVMDAHPEPYRFPDLEEMGYLNEGANVRHRSLMRDATFSLNDSVDFSYGGFDFSGMPAVSSFHDSLGYYPGAELVNRGPGYPADDEKWVTKQWDASATTPARDYYPMKAFGYQGSDALRFDCSAYTDSGRLGCYWFPSGTGMDGGTGNPGDYGAQYGWHVQIVEQAKDGTWAKVKIWNSPFALEQRYTADVDAAGVGDMVTFKYDLVQNQGSAAVIYACAPVDPTKAQYVEGSATNGAVPLSGGCPPAGMEANSLQAAAPGSLVKSVAWKAGVMAGDAASFSFQLKVTTNMGGLPFVGDLNVYFMGSGYSEVIAAPVVTTMYNMYMPVVSAPKTQP